MTGRPTKLVDSNADTAKSFRFGAREVQRLAELRGYLDAHRPDDHHGKAFTESDTVRHALRLACEALGLSQGSIPSLPRSTPVVAPSPAPPPVASSKAVEDKLLRELDRLADASAYGLADAAELTRASGLPVPLANVALEALRVAGTVQLRPDTSPGLRKPADEHLRPRTAAGSVVGYVARVEGAKPSRTVEASETQPKRPAKREKNEGPSDDELRAAVRAHCELKGRGSQTALAKAISRDKRPFGDWLAGTRTLPAEPRAALVRELRKLGAL